MPGMTVKAWYNCSAMFLILGIMRRFQITE
jgi:hypothetical protein